MSSSKTTQRLRHAQASFPAIAREAKAEHAAIYWGDEMGLRSDHVAGRSYAPLGKTPVVRATGQRLGCSMLTVALSS